ncbi:DUF305 domain-containing protein [Streptomyces capparidis]
MTSHRSLARRAALVAATAAAAAVLAACGSDDGHGGHDPGSTTSPSASPSASAPAEAAAHNAADVTFAKDMIRHHRQAIAMADLAATRASSADVESLAEKVKGAQEPEIRTLSGWLTSWGEQVPEEGAGADHGGHDMSSGMPGMMSPTEMDRLEKASGTAFDTMFLDMMIKHHEGAVTMARTEKEDGEYGAAMELADKVIADQSAEIRQMEKMLGKR